MSAPLSSLKAWYRFQLTNHFFIWLDTQAHILRICWCVSFQHIWQAIAVESYFSVQLNYFRNCQCQLSCTLSDQLQTHQLSSTCWDSRNAVIPLQHEPTRSCNDKDLDLGQEATLCSLVAGKDGKDHQQQRKTVKPFSLGKDHQWTSITSSQHPCDDVAMMCTSKPFIKRITA